MDENSEKTLNDSLQRCLNNNDFIAIFYQHFVDSDPEIRELFKNSDMARQQEMMGKSLMSMIAASEENWHSDQQLVNLSRQHQQLSIQPRHFELWEQSLLKTIAQCDPDFDEKIASCWQKIIKRGKEFMISR